MTLEINFLQSILIATEKLSKTVKRKLTKHSRACSGPALTSSSRAVRAEIAALVCSMSVGTRAAAARLMTRPASARAHHDTHCGGAVVDHTLRSTEQHDANVCNYLWSLDLGIVQHALEVCSTSNTLPALQYVLLQAI